MGLNTLISRCRESRRESVFQTPNGAEMNRSVIQFFAALPSQYPTEGDDFSVGNTVMYSCNTGYKILGKAAITCGKNGLWTLDAPICEPVRCPEPRNQNNGVVLYSGSFFGQRAEYRCLNGYELVGNAFSVCRENGKWDPLPPTCRPVSCGPPPKIESATVHTKGTEFGSNAQYVCQIGFRVKSPSESVLSCLENGTWSQPYPHCDIVRCPVPLPIGNGNPVYSDNSFESTVEYYCDKGYRLEGPIQRMCQADGKWSGEKPRCERVQCPALSKPLNGILLADDLYYASDAIYSCETGHEIHEPNVKPSRIGEAYRRICQEDGTWSGNQPKCQPVNCDSDVLRLENGRVSGTEFSFGSILQYSCETGYKLVGTDTRKCGTDKRWNGEPPFCQIIQCPEPAIVPNGNFIGHLSRNFGETLEYACDKGHRLVGAKALTCTESGKWNNPIPECVKINCSQPNNIEHGMTYTKSLSYGSYVRYQCSRGYDLHGPEERQCEENGQWTLKEPFCRRIQCHTLPKIANSKLSNGIFYFGNVLTIECQIGYKIFPDNVTLKCDENGKWKGEFPRCDRIICSNPKEIKFGGFQGDDYSFENKITYRCNDGWELLGEETLSCGSDGIWSSEAPICVGTKCPTLVKVENSVSNSTETKYGTVVFFACLPGYVLRGKQKLTCQIDNKWSGTTPRCDPVNCTRVVNVSNGKCQGDSVHFGSELSCVCDEGYQLHGQNVLTCTENGRWSGEDPICAPVSCPIPDSLYNGQVYLIRTSGAKDINKSVIHPGFGSISKKVSSRSLVPNAGFRRSDIKVDGNFILTESRNEAFLYKDELSYECDEGYDLIGVSIRVCDPEGKWSNEEPVCQLVFCESPSTPFNGYVSFQAPPVFGSEADYHCDTGYEPVGPTKVLCLSNGTWSGISPICAVIECETPPSLGNGTVRVTSLSYGSVALYACEEGYKLVGEPLRTCDSNKSWTGTDPQCELIECPEIPATRYGVISYEKRTVQSNARLTCEAGYEVPRASSDSATCLLNGMWSDSFEDCVPVKCPEIRVLRNGSVTIYNGTSFYNSVLGFKCDRGFVLVGSQTRTCLSSKTWSGSETICQPVTCRLLTVPSHGTLTVTGITYNSEAKFSCLEGYNLIGSRSTRCLENSQWSKPPPKCQIITCPNIGDIERGFVYGKSNVYKSSYSFVCQPKYRLIGPEKIECLLKGRWSGPIPTCRRHLCDELPKIENSELLNTLSGTLEVNSTLEVQCQRGYRLEGNGSIKCDHRGHWRTNGISPRCTLITCEKLNEIANGFHNGSDENGIVFVPDSLIEFECDPGYVLAGKNRSTCQLNGKWFPKPPSCDKICNEPPKITNGKGYVEEHNDGTSELIYTCDQGYKLMGNDRDICDKDKPYWLLNGTWCERIVCGQLISVTQATIALTDSYVGSLATYSCSKGYYLIGNSSLICTENGEWMGRVPKCEPLLCLPPKAPENGFVVLKEHQMATTPINYTVEMATFHCAVGYILIGNKTIKCKNGEWQGNSPSCAAISCGKPNFSARVIYTGSSYDYGKELRVQCPPGTVLKGNGTIICLANGSWSQQPDCEDSCSPPCKAGQICLRGSCQCPHGYAGQDCSHPICILPCLHGGWCKAPYQCQCNPGFKGERCQIRVKRIISRTISLASNKLYS